VCVMPRKAPAGVRARPALIIDASLVDTFCSICPSADRRLAEKCLRSANGDLNRAVSAFLVRSEALSSKRPAPSSPTQPSIETASSEKRQRVEGVRPDAPGDTPRLESIAESCEIVINDSSDGEHQDLSSTCRPTPAAAVLSAADTPARPKADPACDSAPLKCEDDSEGVASTQMSQADPAATEPPQPERSRAALQREASALLGPHEAFVLSRPHLDEAAAATERAWAAWRDEAGLAPSAQSAGAGRGAPPPPPSRTKWTRRVLHPVLIGHAASLTPY